MNTRTVAMTDEKYEAMQSEIERLTQERDLALANADAVYAKLMPEVERLRAALEQVRVKSADHEMKIVAATALRLNQQ